MAELSTFIVVQEGRAFAPVTMRSEGLLLGHARECDLRLNDPSIPPALAGIKEIGDHFYFLPLEPSPFEDAKRTAVEINGRDVRGAAALASGDVLVIGSYRILVDKQGDALVLRLNYPDPETSPVSESDTPVKVKSIEAGERKTSSFDDPDSQAANDLVREWLERHPWRDRRKVASQNSLTPRPLKRNAATEYNWAPTSDLVPPWPVLFLFLCILVVGAVALMAFFLAPSIFAPGRVSRAHNRTEFSLAPAIALKSAPNSCMGCHKSTAAMDQNCISCHQAEGFHPSTLREHQAAGITCIRCHTEHQGSNFSPKAAAFDSCATCHNDNNKQIYNGWAVRTPHGGTFGYPVSGGKWIWKGLDEEALKLKPEVAATWLTGDTEQKWRSKQFHAIHLYRVKTAPGIREVKDGVLQCSSCHNSFAPNLDRETPRQTCSKCHNAYADDRTGALLVAAEQANCTSCHVQHYYDVHRWGDLLTEPDQEKRRRAIDGNYIDAVRRTAAN
ncbi:MAG TPA: hypothetical protein VGO68_17395 [Pyrinomonadaceae bacterium]|jgi:hypothetical protein|nr:hypothetical protein [Pyrinomonadaceae bacterium]